MCGSRAMTKREKRSFIWTLSRNKKKKERKIERGNSIPCQSAIRAYKGCGGWADCAHRCIDDSTVCGIYRG